MIGKQMGFWSAYWRAAGVAWLILAVSTVTATLVWPSFSPTGDMLVLSVLFVPYVFAATLVLGGLGLGVLHLLRWKRLPCYQGTGFVLGALVACALLYWTGPLFLAGGATLFGMMGLAAATTFRHARPPT
ncbi:MAG TPA: hypothetical protein VEW03_00305 [Longimicrobiaceae bacterium]|nr:hypothetical protein [Longimicrobiaceae bacterium]